MGTQTEGRGCEGGPWTLEGGTKTNAALGRTGQSEWKAGQLKVLGMQGHSRPTN